MRRKMYSHERDIRTNTLIIWPTVPAHVAFENIINAVSVFYQYMFHFVEGSPALFSSMRRMFSWESQAETGTVLSEWREAVVLDFFLYYIQ